MPTPLQPQHDSRKSFYEKANVIYEGGNLILESYGTRVAEIRNGKPIIHGTYSPTTLRHIKEFLKQQGFKAENMKQILKDYGEKQAYTTGELFGSAVPSNVKDIFNVKKETGAWN